MSPEPFAPTLEPIARGVWLMRGGLPKRTMNVYLLADGEGVTMFDAGISTMTEPLRAVAERMGGLSMKTGPLSSRGRSDVVMGRS